MIAVRPPEYFPGPGYCALMAASRRFIVADTFQFSRQSFHNRSLLRTPAGRQWITIPLEGGGRGQSIQEAFIDRRKPWASRHRRALAYNYRSSPYFEYYEERVMEVLDHPWERLGEVTVATVRLVHSLLNLESEVLVASEHLSPPPVDLPEAIQLLGKPDLIGVLSDAAAHDVLHLPGLTAVEVEPAPYRQVFPGFVSGLSILDLLFNLGPDARKWLESHIRMDRDRKEDHPSFGKPTPQRLP